MRSLTKLFKQNIFISWWYWNKQKKCDLQCSCVTVDQNIHLKFSPTLLFCVTPFHAFSCPPSTASVVLSTLNCSPLSVLLPFLTRWKTVRKVNQLRSHVSLKVVRCGCVCGLFIYFLRLVGMHVCGLVNSVFCGRSHHFSSLSFSSIGCRVPEKSSRGTAAFPVD